MIYDAQRRDKLVDKDLLLEHLKKKKYKRVIDIGGSQKPWAKEFVNAYIDIMDPREYLKRFDGWLDDGLVNNSDIWVNDLDDDLFWREFIDGLDGSEHNYQGPYDFAICSHVIEHVANPYLILRNLPIIAKRGWVAVPAVGIELKLQKNYDIVTRGGPLHRWICVLSEEKDGHRFWMYPKFPFVQTMDGLEWADKTPDGLQTSFYWENDLPYEVYTEGHTPMKADKSEIMDTYRKAFKEGV